MYLGVISLIGNGLAAHVFRRKGREISVPEVILLNIAIVDLFLAGASYPATIISAFSHRWIFEDIGKASPTYRQPHINVPFLLLVFVTPMLVLWDYLDPPGGCRGFFRGCLYLLKE